jgi:hypothetical protein
MGFVTAITDVQDSTGASIIVQRPDGTRSPMALKVGSGLSTSFAQSGDIGIVSLSVTAPSVPVATAIAPVTYTDAIAHTVATVSVPISGSVLVKVTIVANLGMNNGVPNVNTPNAVGLWENTILMSRVGSGSVQAAPISVLASASAPFLPLAVSASPGLVNLLAVGASQVAIQVNGFAPTEAWTSGHTYTRGDGSTTVGQFVTANGNVYLCTTSGTASGSAPSGTGTGLGSGAKFDCVCTGSTTIPVQWAGYYSVPITD